MAKTRKSIPDNFNSPLADNLRKFRAKTKEPQETVAALLNVKRQTVSSYEDGSNVPPLDKLITLAQHYNVSLDRLCGISQGDTPEIANTMASTHLSNHAVKQLLEWGECINRSDGAPSSINQVLSRSYRERLNVLSYLAENTLLLDALCDCFYHSDDVQMINAVAKAYYQEKGINASLEDGTITEREDEIKNLFKGASIFRAQRVLAEAIEDFKYWEDDN